MTELNPVKGAASDGGSFFCIEYLTSRNNKKTLKINGILIHSQHDPLREGRGIVDDMSRKLFVVMGLGAGYHIINLMSSSPGSYCVVFEPVPELYRAAGTLLADAAVECGAQDVYMNELSERILVINGINEPEIFSFISSNGLQTGYRLVFYTNPGYKSLFCDNESPFHSAVRKQLELNIQNLFTESNFIPLWYKNIIKNYIDLARVPFIRFGKSIENGNSAVIAGAGPTLDKDIGTIKKYQDRAVIFAVDTAIIPLIKNGIVPDYIISLDTQFYSIYDFICRIPEQSTLICDITAYPALKNIHANTMFTFTSNTYKGFLTEYLSAALRVDGIELNCTGGTVSDYAVTIALKMGFKRIILSGVDFSFPDNRTHCKSSPYHINILTKSDYITTPDTMVAAAIKNRSPHAAEGDDGGKVLSDFILSNYSYYMESLIAENGDAEFYKGCGGAMKMNGIKYVDLSLLLGNLPVKKRDTLCEPAYVNGDCVKELYKSLLNGLYSATVELGNLIKATNFDSGEQDLIAEWERLYGRIITEYPFMEKFLKMTEAILNKKGIYNNTILWYKHTSFKLLQSAYYMIRVIQKIK